MFFLAIFCSKSMITSFLCTVQVYRTGFQKIVPLPAAGGELDVVDGPEGVPEGGLQGPLHRHLVQPVYGGDLVLGQFVKIPGPM